MSQFKRVFILGAGFSRPAGVPLATELLPLLCEKLSELDDMREWLNDLQERLTWLSRGLNIEEVFHYAHFDVEVWRLRQHSAPAGRHDGPGTPWNQGESVKSWLRNMEDALPDVIFERDDRSDLTPIKRWAQAVNEHDAVVTFNYDTLVERALAELQRPWNHGMECEGDNGTPVFKLHGSIDWIVAHREDKDPCKRGFLLLFDKENVNRPRRNREAVENDRRELNHVFGEANASCSEGNTEAVEDDYRLWRVPTREQLCDWIKHRNLQRIPKAAFPRTVGIAGLGAYKEPHRVPGLGRVWAGGMGALYKADIAVVVGYSMPDFDAMAQMQFAQVAMARQRQGRPLRVIVIDPCAGQANQDRFARVFRSVDFILKKHEDVNWSSLD